MSALEELKHQGHMYVLPRKIFASISSDVLVNKMANCYHVSFSSD